MFPSLRLAQISCPRSNCTKVPFCLFSHSTGGAKEETVTKKRRRGSEEAGYSKVHAAAPINHPQAGTSRSSHSSMKLDGSKTPAVRKTMPTTTPIPVQSPIPPVAITSVKRVEPKPDPSQNKRLKTSVVPILQNNLKMSSKVPLTVRQSALSKFHAHFTRIYANLASVHTLSHVHSLSQESKLYTTSQVKSYTGLAVGILLRLKARGVALDEDDVGIDGTWKARPARTAPTSLSKLILTLPEMIAHDYPTKDHPRPASTRLQKCSRCETDFEPVALIPSTMHVCTYHWGRKQRHGDGRIWTCCNVDLFEKGCSTGPHVYKSELDTDGFVVFKEGGLAAVGIDCEMSYTTLGLSLVRATVVGWDGIVLADLFVKPKGDILDLNTRFSGVDNVEGGISLEECIALIGVHVGAETVVIGHGLENDLIALGVLHDRCIDTANLYPHHLGLPYRNSLAYLARTVLGRVIQGGEHSSVEDARASVDLVQKFLEKNGGHKPNLS